MMEFAAPGHDHGFASWALAWSIYITIGVPLVLWSTVAFWGCLWLSILYFAFHFLIYGISNGPKTFWQWITGQTKIPTELELEMEKPRSVFDDHSAFKRMPAAPPAWPGRKTITPKNRRPSGPSLRDFEIAVNPPLPVPTNLAYRPRLESIQVLASNVDGDFGDTGGWAYSYEDDEANWTAKNTRLDQSTFNPGLHATSDVTFGRSAGSPRWSFAESMVRTPMPVRTPSSHIDPKEDRRRSLMPTTRSGRATPIGGLTVDGYFPPQLLETSPTAINFDSNNFTPRRASVLHRVHRSTTSLDSVPELMDHEETLHESDES